MSELERLKKRARKLYQAAMSCSDFDCGRNLSEYIRPEIGLARKEFNAVWEQIQQLDKNAPSNPFNQREVRS